MSAQIITPKVFISYSWQPSEHKGKVIELAQRLVGDGIDVIIDEWELHPGMDNHTFMEKMVTDNSVNNVLIICNKEYKEKANNKSGGVGKESLIISGELYSKAEQTKFIPVIYEFDKEGKPQAPVFINTRFFIDLSNEDTFVDSYSKLVRTIYGKPESQKPQLGTPPAFITEDEKIILPTAYKISGIKSALLADKRHAGLLVEEYLESFIEALKTFRIDYKTLDKTTFHNDIVNSIDKMLPLRDDFINFIQTYLKYSIVVDIEMLHRFFEKMIDLLINDDGYYGSSGNNLENLALDNYRFFYYELFLYFTLVMIDKEKFSELAFILTSPYIINTHNQEVFDFTEFKTSIASLNEFYKQRNNLSRVSVVADKIKERTSPNFQFESIISVDIFLHYMSMIHFPYGRWTWFPEISTYRMNSSQILVMKKAISKRYFDKLKVLFSVETKEEFLTKIEMVEKRQSTMNIGFYYNIPTMKIGVNYDKLCTYA